MTTTTTSETPQVTGETAAPVGIFCQHAAWYVVRPPAEVAGRWMRSLPGITAPMALESYVLIKRLAPAASGGLVVHAWEENAEMLRAIEARLIREQIRRLERRDR